MILDSTLEFCDAVSVATTAGTSLIGNQIDITTARNIGAGQPVYLVITVDTAIVTGGSAGTIQFVLASDDSASVHTTTSTRHITTAAYVTDDAPAIPAGTLLYVGALPSGIYSQVDYEQFLGLLLIVGTTTITAGKINAFLTIDPPGWKAFTDAVN